MPPKKKRRCDIIPGLPRSVQMTDFQRGAVLALRHHNHSYGDIAAEVGVSKATVMRLLNADSPYRSSEERERAVPRGD